MILDKLVKLAPREKIGIAIALVIVMGVFVDRLAVRPVVGRISELQAGITGESDKLEYSLRVLAMKDDVEKEYDRVIKLIHVASSSAEAIDAMKGQIDELSRQSGVNLASWEEGAPGKALSCDEYSVAVREFEARESDLLDFLHELRVSPGLLRVDDLKFSPDKEKGVIKGSMLITKVMISSPGG